MGHAIIDCPLCGMEVTVPAGAVGRHHCPGCGGLVVVAPSGGDAMPDVIPLLCPRCGAPRREGQGACPACGVPYPASPPRYAWRSVALGILIGILGALVTYLLTRRP